jgi:hypothetical protein
MRQSHDGLSRDESFDCVLSFFIKGGIPIVPSDHHHAFTFFGVYKMEIEVRAVILYHCRQGKRGKKIHRKLSNVYGKDLYSLGAVEYWWPEFQAQRADFHEEVRPGRPLIEISAHIARLLNNKPFSSTRHLAR